jgi:hypothetical protein
VILPIILMAYLFSALWSSFGRWIDAPPFWKI